MASRLALLVGRSVKKHKEPSLGRLVDQLNSPRLLYGSLARIVAYWLPRSHKYLSARKLGDKLPEYNHFCLRALPPVLEAHKPIYLLLTFIHFPFRPPTLSNLHRMLS
jgi:hypothetical protein